MKNKEKIRELNNDEFDILMTSIVYGCEWCPNFNKESGTVKEVCHCNKEFLKWLEMECDEK